MAKSFERKCVELFGVCLLDMKDIKFCIALGYSEKEMIVEAARRYFQKEQKEFYEALCDWKDGKKLDITLEQARGRNEKFNMAVSVLQDNGYGTLEPVDWESFPKDDPSVCFYIGLPFTSDLCVWAENYNK